MAHISIRRMFHCLLIAATLGSLGCIPMYVQDGPSPVFQAQSVSVQRPALSVQRPAMFSYLDGHGSWVNSNRFGVVWVPAANRSPGWRPYLNGQWDYTRFGWTWVSGASEPWGRGPYHYGRWAWDNMYRWVWVPGYTWGPAWVSWRTGGGCVGWAPLGPGGVVYNTTNYWTFVPQRNIYRVPIRTVVIRPGQSSVVFRQSNPSGAQARIRTRGGRVISYNAGPRPGAVTTWTGRTIAPRDITQMPTVRPTPYRAANTRATGRAAPAYRVRPGVSPAITRTPSPRVAPTYRSPDARAAPRYTVPSTRTAPSYAAPSRAPVTSRPAPGYRAPTRAVAPRVLPGRAAPGASRSSPYRTAPRASSSRSSSRSSSARSSRGSSSSSSRRPTARGSRNRR